MDKRSVMEAKSMQMVPEISKRRCGGWIAVSGREAPLKIGVTANTEEEARAPFNQAVIEWEEILNSETSKGHQAERRCQ
jgi:hypothetical protein